jgi:type III secretory pathway component EscT
MKTWFWDIMFYNVIFNSLFIRILSAVIFLPIPDSTATKAISKIGWALLLSSVSLNFSEITSLPPFSIRNCVTFIIFESLIGSLVGISLRLLFYGITLMLESVEGISGFTIGEILNPLLQSRGRVVAELGRSFLMVTLIILGITELLIRTITILPLTSLTLLPTISFAKYGYHIVEKVGYILTHLSIYVVIFASAILLIEVIGIIISKLAPNLNLTPEVYGLKALSLLMFLLLASQVDISLAVLTMLQLPP